MFFVRDSTSCVGDFVVSVSGSDKVSHHYIVHRHGPNCYRITGTGTGTCLPSLACSLKLLFGTPTPILATLITISSPSKQGSFNVFLYCCNCFRNSNPRSCCHPSRVLQRFPLTAHPPSQTQTPPYLSFITGTVKKDRDFKDLPEIIEALSPLQTPS